MKREREKERGLPPGEWKEQLRREEEEKDNINYGVKQYEPLFTDLFLVLKDTVDGGRDLHLRDTVGYGDEGSSIPIQSEKSLVKRESLHSSPSIVG